DAAPDRIRHVLQLLSLLPALKTDGRMETSGLFFLSSSMGEKDVCAKRRQDEGIRSFGIDLIPSPCHCHAMASLSPWEMEFNHRTSHADGPHGRRAKSA